MRFGIDRPYMLCVGALQARKNVPLAIEAYARLMGRGTDCELVVAGGDRGGRLDVLDAILRTRLTGRVHLRRARRWTTSCRRSTAARGRSCSRRSTRASGCPALEAMACGTPVIASNTTGLAEAVGDAGLTVDPRSAEELAEALRRVLNDDALRERLVAAGLARAARVHLGARGRAPPPTSTATALA